MKQTQNQQFLNHTPNQTHNNNNQLLITNSQLQIPNKIQPYPSKSLTSSQLETKSRQIIAQVKKQLDQTIEQLDNKIRTRLQKNQDRFLYAYHNHMRKITEQLKRMKQNQQAFEQRFSNDKAIMHLSKLCALFRQEAMRLSNQLEDALIQVSVYRRKCQLQAGEIQGRDEGFKKFVRDLKGLQMENKRLGLEVQGKEKIIYQLNARIDNGEHKKQPQIKNNPIIHPNKPQSPTKTPKSSNPHKNPLTSPTKNKQIITQQIHSYLYQLRQNQQQTMYISNHDQQQQQEQLQIGGNMNSNSNSNMNGNSNSNSNRLTQFQIYSELSMLIDNARQLIQKQSININNNDNDKDKYINSTVRQFICNQQYIQQLYSILFPNLYNQQHHSPTFITSNIVHANFNATNNNPTTIQQPNNTNTNNTNNRQVKLIRQKSHTTSQHKNKHNKHGNNSNNNNNKTISQLSTTIMRKLKLQYDTRQIDRLWQDSGKAKDNDINNNNVSKYQLKGGTQYTRSYSNIDNNYIGEQTNDNHVTNTNTNTNNDTNNNMKINLTRILDIKLSSSKNKNNNNNRLPVRSVSKDKLHLDQKELQYISRRSNVKTQGCQFVWNKLGLAKQKDRGENGVENGKGHAQTHRNISGYTQLHLQSPYKTKQQNPAQTTTHKKAQTKITQKFKRKTLNNYHHHKNINKNQALLTQYYHSSRNNRQNSYSYSQVQ